MGYRSDVGIKCRAKAFEKFKEVYEKVGLYPTQIFEKTEDGQDEKILVWEWVKWYDSYPEIQAIEEVMDELNDDEFFKDIPNEEMSDWGYKFIRLGEDGDDVEERDNDCDVEFYYIRQFDIDSDFHVINS